LQKPDKKIHLTHNENVDLQLKLYSLLKSVEKNFEGKHENEMHVVKCLDVKIQENRNK